MTQRRDLHEEVQRVRISPIAEETFSVRLPHPVAVELRAVARAEGNRASSVIRRLLTRALQIERAQQQRVAAAVQR